jgi:regulator of protease activity HflC (stomatin/prohibitin superfamily)
MTRLPFLIGGALLLLIVILNSAFIVRQDHQAIILQYGKYQRVINAPAPMNPAFISRYPLSKASLTTIAATWASRWKASRSSLPTKSA